MIVYTGGTFDLFHCGHVNFLKQCAQFGDVVVSLNTDEFITKYKGKPPIMTYEERKTVLESCKYVSCVMPNIGGHDSKAAIMIVNPNIIIVGSDWAKKNYYKQMEFTQKWLDKRNIYLMYIPYTQNISTTEIKRRLLDK